jgi:flagellar biosynthesis protein FlhA
LLDLFFTFNIAISVIVMLVAMSVMKPLDFSVFPTVLLVTTLLRLSLNVASTRVVLLEGHTGPGAAGQVIEAFGHFLVGGNYAVGLVVFTILVVINFVVITKGAGRVAEVAARFTLDAMPGKQMAIDADLNAGLIGEEDARKRRATIAQEADFFGSMDGASKFVRGDAVAGILIMLINVVGGLFIGVLQHNLDIGTAAKYLHPADDWRRSGGADSGADHFDCRRHGRDAGWRRRRCFAAVHLATVQQSEAALSDGRDHRYARADSGHAEFRLPAPRRRFGGAWPGRSKSVVSRRRRRAGRRGTRGATGSSGGQLGRRDAARRAGLEVGYRLIPLVDKSQDGELLRRIRGIRKKFAQEVGFLVSPVHIRDNLELKPNAYKILLKGVEIGEGEAFPGNLLAINPGRVAGQVAGTPTKDPAFGLPAVWIDPALREQAQAYGYTVVDASTVTATHLNHLILSHAAELLGRQETQALLDHLAKDMPKLVEDVVPKLLSLGVVQKVLRNLLEEGVHLRDMRTIIETLADAHRARRIRKR